MSSVAAIYGDAAVGALSYPMAPQLLTPEELEVIAGSLQGWGLLGDINPTLKAWSSTYGGGVIDGALKLKLQSWFRNWVEPAPHYVVHQPRLANGMWFRIFRTTMRVAERTQQALRDIGHLHENELVARYAHLLGVGARERYPDFEQWWSATLACIQQGEWHLAVYSPRWESFVSPVNDVPESNSLVDRCLAEFPPVAVQLYPGSSPDTGAWDLAEAIRDGAMVEVIGDTSDAPPFGNWGPGAQVTLGGGVNGRTIAGIIHYHPERIQVARVVDGGMGTVEVDAPNLGALLQDIYSVTGWRPDGFSREAVTGQDPKGLEPAVLALTEDFTRVLCIPGPVFQEAIQSAPRIVPVYGRLISTFTHVEVANHA